MKAERKRFNYDMPDEAFENYRREFLRAGLRRLSSRWPFAYEALRRARVERGKYRCAMCPPDVLYRRGQVQKDHIIPMSGKDGFHIDLLPEIVRRLLVRVEGYQMLCRPHHKEKTRGEIGEIAKRRKRKKKEKK